MWLYQSPAEGMAPWCYTTWVNHPYDDFDNEWRYWSDMMLAYPTWEDPIPTLCWEATREGIDDARYITTLQNLLTQARTKGISGAAISEAEAMLDAFSVPYLHWKGPPELNLIYRDIATRIKDKAQPKDLRWAMAWRILAVQEDIVAAVHDDGVEESATLPSEITLMQNYPNPFNPMTSIRFGLTRRAKVTVTIYNILGQKISTITEREYIPGEHTVHWNGRDGRDMPLSSGVYVYELKTETSAIRKKMMLLR